jgi:RNA polymerase sigma-70 factor (ECF subfamily)
MAAGQVTECLARWRAGDRDALERLVPLVYDELRDVARRQLRRESADHTLSATALVHEVYLRLLRQRQLAAADRDGFLAIAAQTMRRILVDHARARARVKRGGGAARVPWGANVEIRSESGAEELKLLDLHRALDALRRENPGLAEAVEMHYFGGLTAEEVALAAGRSPHVVRHELRVARAWLRRALAG